jgi:Spy/CpxP family protein refolding chaperone
MFWKHAWAFAHCGPPSCGPHKQDGRWQRDERKAHDHQSHSRGGWSPFGVRRPLRFMARQLDLDEDQVAKMAAILDDLKTQRAQARVDRRKAVGTFADAFLADSFDADQVKAACEARADSEREVEAAVARALERTFEVLDADQRKRLSYLLRSEGLSI